MEDHVTRTAMKEQAAASNINTKKNSVPTQGHNIVVQYGRHPLQLPDRSCPAPYHGFEILPPHNKACQAIETVFPDDRPACTTRVIGRPSFIKNYYRWPRFTADVSKLQTGKCIMRWAGQGRQRMGVRFTSKWHESHSIWKSADRYEAEQKLPPFKPHPKHYDTRL